MGHSTVDVPLDLEARAMPKPLSGSSSPPMLLSLFQRTVASISDVPTEKELVRSRVYASQDLPC